MGRHGGWRRCISILYALQLLKFAIGEPICAVSRGGPLSGLILFQTSLGEPRNMPRNKRESVPVEPLAWPVRKWCATVSLSESYVYELMSSGVLDSIKVGGKRLIVTTPREFIARHKTA